MENKQKLAEFKPHKLFVGFLKSGKWESRLCVDQKSIITALKEYDLDLFEMYDLKRIENKQPYIDKINE